MGNIASLSSSLDLDSNMVIKFIQFPFDVWH